MASAGTEPTVMVVDDDVDLLDMISDTLSDEGYEVVRATNGKEALARLRHGPRPSVILLDLHMPVMNGREFREKQLRDPDLSRIPVLVITASARFDPDRDGLPGVPTLGKPFELADMLDRVRRYVMLGEQRLTTEHALQSRHR